MSGIPFKTYSTVIVPFCTNKQTKMFISSNLSERLIMYLQYIAYIASLIYALHRFLLPDIQNTYDYAKHVFCLISVITVLKVMSY